MTEPATAWQGEIEHIQSGERWDFTCVDDLLGFLRRQTEEPETSIPESFAS